MYIYALLLVELFTRIYGVLPEPALNPMKESVRININQEDTFQN